MFRFTKHTKKKYRLLLPLLIYFFFAAGFFAAGFFSTGFFASGFFAAGFFAGIANPPPTGKG